jgi:hypothetical protein
MFSGFALTWMARQEREESMLEMDDIDDKFAQLSNRKPTGD